MSLPFFLRKTQIYGTIFHIFALLIIMAKALQRNTLLRYKNIRDLYLEHKTEDIPDTVVLRKYIFPTYPISRTTLNTILNCPIDKYLTALTSANS